MYGQYYLGNIIDKIFKIKPENRATTKQLLGEVKS